MCAKPQQSCSNNHCNRQTETKYSPNPGLLYRAERSKGYLRIKEDKYSMNGKFLLNLGKPAPPVNRPFCLFRHPVGLEKFYYCTRFVFVKVIVFQQTTIKITPKQKTACLNLINRILIHLQNRKYS